MNDAIKTVLDTFNARGSRKYGLENVTQLQHALQSAVLAVEEGADGALVVAALLHDIGHILDSDELPSDADCNLDDGHEHSGHAWVLQHFGKAVAEAVRLHVLAKRYLCSTDPAYEQVLSPTSHKSFLDQGGRMNETEIKAFETEPYFKQALRLRRWDDVAKDPTKKTPPIEDFVPQLEAYLA